MERPIFSLDGAWDFHFSGDAKVALENCELAAVHRAGALAGGVPRPAPAKWQGLVPAHVRAVRRVAEPRRLPPLRRRQLPREGAREPHARDRARGRLAALRGGHRRRSSPWRNEVAVHVTAPTDDPAAYPEYPFSEIPAGKQSWYGPLGGIWQPILLERRALDHIRLVRLRPQRNGGVVEVMLDLSRPLSVPHDLELQIDGPDGRTAKATGLALAAGEERARASLAIAEPLDWSPDAPHLYQLQAVLRRGGEVADLVRERFGFRSIETRAGRIYLNGQPLFLRGALDQDYYPTGSAHRRPRPFWRISSAKPKPSGSTACAATSRCPIRGTTRLPTGSAS